MKHFAAMQLILSMQDEKGDYPNVDYVRKNPKALPVRKIPTLTGDRDEKFRYLRDMFILVDPRVYKAFHDMVTKDGIVKNEGGQKVVGFKLVKENAKRNASIFQRVNELFPKNLKDPMYPNGVLLWDCQPPPHPISLIIREVVADLLADRLD